MFFAHTQNAIIGYTCEKSCVETSYIMRFEDKKHFDKKCMEGCMNYGKKWSCPPYSPTYSSFVKDYNYIEIYMLCMELDQFSYIKQDYLKVKAANSILKSRIDKALREVINENMFYISTGSCRLCKSCNKKSGKVCAHPNLHTYSFEALGINVSNLTKDIFDKELLWYRKGYLPNYTSVVAGLLKKDRIKNSRVLEVLDLLN